MSFVTCLWRYWIIGTGVHNGGGIDNNDEVCTYPVPVPHNFLLCTQDGGQQIPRVANWIRLENRDWRRFALKRLIEEVFLSSINYMWTPRSKICLEIILVTESRTDGCYGATRLIAIVTRLRHGSFPEPNEFRLSFKFAFLRYILIYSKPRLWFSDDLLFFCLSARIL